MSEMKQTMQLWVTADGDDLADSVSAPGWECPKCGMPVTRAKYSPAVPPPDTGRRCRGGKKRAAELNAEYDAKPDVYKAEHLVLACVRCRYTWAVACLDAESNTRKVTTARDLILSRADEIRAAEAKGA